VNESLPEHREAVLEKRNRPVASPRPTVDLVAPSKLCHEVPAKKFSAWTLRCPSLNCKFRLLCYE
jgi:hypothetical protein